MRTRRERQRELSLRMTAFRAALDFMLYKQHVDGNRSVDFSNTQQSSFQLVSNALPTASRALSILLPQGLPPV